MKVIIPIKNEQKNIVSLLKSIPVVFSIYLVFNGTTDNGEDKVQQYIKENKIKNIVVLESNPGKCNAINKALEFILDPDEIVLHLDADVRLASDFFENFNKVSFEKYLLVGGLDIPDLDKLSKEVQTFGTSLCIYRDYLNFIQTLRVARGRKIVIGRCFAYKRRLIKYFPEGIHSEDNWITFITAANYSWDKVKVDPDLKVFYEPASNWLEFINQKIRFEHGYFQIMKLYPEFASIYESRYSNKDIFNEKYFRENIKYSTDELSMHQNIQSVIDIIIEDSLNSSLDIKDIWTKIN